MAKPKSAAAFALADFDKMIKMLDPSGAIDTASLKTAIQKIADEDEAKSKK